MAAVEAAISFFGIPSSAVTDVRLTKRGNPSTSAFLAFLKVSIEKPFLLPRPVTYYKFFAWVLGFSGFGVIFDRCKESLTHPPSQFPSFFTRESSALVFLNANVHNFQLLIEIV